MRVIFSASTLSLPQLARISHAKVDGVSSASSNCDFRLLGVISAGRGRRGKLNFLLVTCKLQQKLTISNFLAIQNAEPNNCTQTETYICTPAHSLANHIEVTKSKITPKVMKGSLSHEFKSTAEVWEVYGGLLLAQLIPQLLPDVLPKAEVVVGDGGVGTVLRLTFPPGIPGLEYQKEKFIKVDNENFVKEALVIEGGFLDLGFLKYLVRVELVGDVDKTCTIRSTVEYEVDDKHTCNASFVTTSTFARIAEAITKYIKVQKGDEKAPEQT